MCRQWETLGHVHADEEFDIADILDGIYCQGEYISNGSIFSSLSYNGVLAE